MGNPEIERAFDNPSALKINQARLDHLASLGLDLEGKRVLEVGAGVGHLTGFWEERGCEVVSTEGRAILVQENVRRHPGRRGRVFPANICDPQAHLWLGRFDIVFCYGALYHTNRPLVAIRSLSVLCDELFLLETRVYPEDNGEINRVRETVTPNQSLDGHGCRPARNWVMWALRQFFPYVYATKTRPDFPDFIPKWPTLRKKVRFVFVASRSKLDLPTLLTELPEKQEILKT